VLEGRRKCRFGRRNDVVRHITQDSTRAGKGSTDEGRAEQRGEQRNYFVGKGF
jgi:hypothetical protein